MKQTEWSIIGDKRCNKWQERNGKLFFIWNLRLTAKLVFIQVSDDFSLLFDHQADVDGMATTDGKNKPNHWSFAWKNATNLLITSIDCAWSNP